VGEIRIIPGKLFFGESNRSIMGKVIKDSEYAFIGFYIRKRLIPVLDDNFNPTDKDYERWEVCLGRQSWFFKTEPDAQIFCVNHWPV
jgi:hypothetical protein